MMIDEGAASEVMDILREECFYNNANKEIFSAIRKLFVNNIVVVDVWRNQKNKLINDENIILSPYININKLINDEI